MESATRSALANDDGSVVCEHCLLAETMFARLRGLLGASGLAEGEGMLLRPASSIHTAFMRFAIDAVFVDKESRVVKVAPGVRPWRAAACRGARPCSSFRRARPSAAGSGPASLLTQVWRSDPASRRRPQAPPSPRATT